MCSNEGFSSTVGVFQYEVKAKKYNSKIYCFDYKHLLLILCFKLIV